VKLLYSSATAYTTAQTELYGGIGDINLFDRSAKAYTTAQTEISGGVGDIYLLYSTAATYIAKQTDNTRVSSKTLGLGLRLCHHRRLD
jgi:hypothetical protein